MHDRPCHGQRHGFHGGHDREAGIFDMERLMRIEVNRQERAAVVMESADRGDRVCDFVHALREVFDRAPVAAAKIEHVGAARQHEIRDVEFERRPAVELASGKSSVEKDFRGVPRAAQVQHDAFAVPVRRDLDGPPEPKVIRHVLAYGAPPARDLIILPRAGLIGAFGGSADLMFPDAAQVDAVTGFGLGVDWTNGG